jgi:hypothetical protein
MKLIMRIVITVILLAVMSYAQPNEIERHVVWERVFDSVPVSALIASESAVSDGKGGAWIATDHPVRIVHISATAELLSNESLPDSLLPSKPSTVVDVRLAAVPSGQIAVLANYWHSVGKAIFFDGAELALMGADGSVTPVKRIVKGGRQYRGFIGLRDEQLLIMGDQTPMTLTDSTIKGDILWHKTFPAKWVLPSGATLSDGSMCIASPEYASPVIHVIQLTSEGVLRRSASVAARRAGVAAGLDGACLILFDTEPKLERGEFFLTAFDHNFYRRWTKLVKSHAPQGGVFYLTALDDGVLVTSDAGEFDATFFAKYDFSGNLLWKFEDTSRSESSYAVPSGEGFFIISAGGRDNKSLRVAFAK